VQAKSSAATAARDRRDFQRIALRRRPPRVKIPRASASIVSIDYEVLPRLARWNVGPHSSVIPRGGHDTMSRRFQLTALFGACAMLVAACGSNGSSTSTGSNGASLVASPNANKLTVKMSPARRALDTALTSETVALRADQRTKVAAIQSTLEATSPAIDDAHSGMREAIASSLEGGAIDETALGAAETKMTAAIAKEREAGEAAMTSLHDVLDATQRQALVDEMHPMKGEHEGMWKGGGRREHMKQLADDLGLSDEQRASFKEKMRAEFGEHKKGGFDREAMHAKIKAMADAFVSDSFDAHAVAAQMPHPFEGKMGHARAMLTIALEVLTPPQRTKLAEKIRAGETMPI
jgi:Spy/CpxP family protein refolding chaperone